MRLNIKQIFADTPNEISVRLLYNVLVRFLGAVDLDELDLVEGVWL